MYQISTGCDNGSGPGTRCESVMVPGVVLVLDAVPVVNPVPDADQAWVRVPVVDPVSEAD